MPRYKLRTLLILLVVLPPLSWGVWHRIDAWRNRPRPWSFQENIDRAQKAWAKVKATEAGKAWIEKKREERAVNEARANLRGEQR